MHLGIQWFTYLAFYAEAVTCIFLNDVTKYDNHISKKFFV